MTSRPLPTKWLAAYALLLFSVLAWFSPWFFSGKVLAPFDIVTEMLLPWREDISQPNVHNHFVSDAVTQYIPYRLFAEQSYQQDGYVGWNPLVFGGTAQHANTMALYFDWSTQLHRILSFWTGWHVGLILQFLIAGFGMLSFLKLRGCGPAVSAFGAMAYMTNWQFVVWIYHHWALSSFCWLPWVLFAIEARKRLSGRWSAAVPIFLAFAFLGGTLQHAAFIVAATASICIGFFLEERRSFSKSLRLIGLFALWGVLAVGLSSFMFEATIRSYLENLTAGHSRGGIGYPRGALQPFKNLLSYGFYLYPYILGSPQSIDLWKMLSSDFFNVASFGSLPVFLAIIALFSKRVPTAAKTLCLMGLVIPLTPLVGPLYHRFQLLWILGGSWAAAEWLHRAEPWLLRKYVKSLTIGVVSLIAIWLAASAALAWNEPRLEQMLRNLVLNRAAASQFGIFRDWMENRAVGLIDYLQIWNPYQITALAGFAIGILGLRSLSKGGTTLPYAMTIGVFVQASVLWIQWTTWSSPVLPYLNNKITQKLKVEVGSGRLAAEGGTLPDVPFPPNTLAPANVAVSSGYDSIHPNGMGTPAAAWEFPGVTHFLGTENKPGPENWEKNRLTEELFLFRNPRPDFVSFEPRQAATAQFDRPTLNTLEIQVPAGTKRVTISENFHVGWQWSLRADEVWETCEKESGGAIAVTLRKPPEQDTILQLRFKPRIHPWTFTAFFLSLVGIGLLLLSKNVQKKQHSI